MFHDAISILQCPICESKNFYMNTLGTIEAYADPSVFVLENVEKIVDGCISDFFVFKCGDCGATDRYTMQDVGKRIRQEITKRVLTLVAKGEMQQAMGPTHKSLIYCGKCSGFDAKGSCPLRIYENCDIKRFPNGL